MDPAIARRPHSAAGIGRHGEQVEAVGAVVMRCALALILLWFGAMKFTSYEATNVAQFIANSPLLEWLHALLGIQGASDLLGVIEIAAGALLLAGFVNPLASAIGSAMAVITFLITLSLMFTTPGVAEPLAGGFPALSTKPGQFLLKDLGLLGISLFILGGSLMRLHADRPGAGANIDAITRAGDPRATILRLGTVVLRYGLALIFLWYGCMKFTSYEATHVAMFISNSPLISWWHALLGIQGAGYLLGVIELSAGVLLALLPIAPRASAVGAAMAVITFLITLSLFFSTPGVAAPMGFPAISGDVGQFLLKDAGLLGISIWLLGQALVATAAVEHRQDTNR